MKKKRISLARLIASFTVAAILSIGMAAPAFASEGGEDPTQNLPPGMVGTQNDPAQAGITKLMRMPMGTTIPNVIFEFDITTNDQDAPVITNKFPLTFQNSDVHCMTENNILKMHHATGDIFAGVTFPHAGAYTYYVTERTTKISDGSPIYETPSGVTYTDQMIFSKAEYKLVVYVANKVPGPGTYINGIGATMVKDNEGNPVSNGGKLDVTPYPEDHSGLHKRSDMIFTNDYIKYPGFDGGGDPFEDTGTALKIGKLVSGTYADKTLPFEFIVSVDKPGLVEEENPTCKVYLIGPDANGVLKNLTHVDLIVNGDDSEVDIDSDDDGDYVVFTAGSTIKAKLSHGQYLAFVGISTGAKVNVTESAGSAGYRASYSVIFNGSTASNSTAPNLNQAWSIPDANNYTGDKKNSVMFTNNLPDISQTGISVDNLPFIVIIAMCALALAGYVVFRTRRNAKHNA